MSLKDTKQIHIFCDVGKSKVIVMDSHLDKVFFAHMLRKREVYGEYLALSFALRYIKNIYKDRDILLITDAKSENDVLNGNSEHKKNQKWKTYSDNLKIILEEIRYTNIFNILWMARRYNHAGRILEGFQKEKLTLYAQTNFEELDFDSLEPIKEISTLC